MGNNENIIDIYILFHIFYLMHTFGFWENLIKLLLMREA